MGPAKQSRKALKDIVDTLQPSYIRSGFKGHSKVFMSSLYFSGVTMVLASEVSCKSKMPMLSVLSGRNDQIPED